MATTATDVNVILKDMLYDASTALDNLNFYDKVVGFDVDANGVASSEATFVFSAPPVARTSYVNSKSLLELIYPIGAVQQLTVNSGKQIIPFRELGSRLPRQAAGSTQYSGSMAQVLTGFQNLKSAIYSWLWKMYPNGILLSRTPSDGNSQFIGLESELYNIPFGLIVFVGTSGGRIIQAQYLEKCHIVNDGSSFQAGNPLIADNMSFTITRSIPLINGLQRVNNSAAATAINTALSKDDAVKKVGVDGNSTMYTVKKPSYFGYPTINKA